MAVPVMKGKVYDCCSHTCCSYTPKCFTASAALGLAAGSGCSNLKNSWAAAFFAEPGMLLRPYATLVGHASGSAPLAGYRSACIMKHKHSAALLNNVRCGTDLHRVHGWRLSLQSRPTIGLSAHMTRSRRKVACTASASSTCAWMPPQTA